MLIFPPKTSQHSNNAASVLTNSVSLNDELTSAALMPASAPSLDKQVFIQQKIKDKQKATDTRRFSHLISIMPAGVLVIDQHGRICLANEQATLLLGEPLLGQLWREVINRVFSPKADDGHEVSMKNGKRVKIDISPITEEKGQLIVITDLTETRELQSRMGHMKRLSSLGKMVASLAHQVRTPLSSALLYADNLNSMQLNNDMAERFTNKLTHRLKELESQVNDMLLFAKSSDKQIVDSLSAAQIIKHAYSQIEAQVNQAKIKVDINLSKDIINEKVLGNLTAISGALGNLMANAMQALTQAQSKDLIKECEATIELLCKKEVRDQSPYLVFTVKDNGIGLDKSSITQLFEPFYTTKSQGTGLGLAVVNTVAKSHKGHVNFGNNESGGAFFSLLLPSIENSTSEATNIQLQTGVNTNE